MHFQKGFTLIELMVVVMIIAIFAAIAIPSYQQYIERRDLAVAKQEAQRIATELERFKSKNFSYKGFDATYIFPDYTVNTGVLNIPVGANTNNIKYVITLRDLKTHKILTSSESDMYGLNWVIRVQRATEGTGENIKTKQPNNYDLLLTSTGLRCMSKTQAAFENFDDGQPNCTSIVSNSEAW